jgi:hypothetical protein
VKQQLVLSYPCLRYENLENEITNRRQRAWACCSRLEADARLSSSKHHRDLNILIIKFIYLLGSVLTFRSGSEPKPDPENLAKNRTKLDFGNTNLIPGSTVAVIPSFLDTADTTWINVQNSGYYETSLA